jgi:hypothetical protein
MEEINIQKNDFHKICSDSEIQNMEGHFINETSIVHHIKNSMDGYVILENGTRNLLFKFRKSVIPENLCQLAIQHFEAPSKKKNYNRGASAGLLEKDKMPKNVSDIVQTEKFRAKVGKYQIGNLSQSNIVGYFDDTKSKSIYPCRTTKFTRDNPEIWEKCLPLIKYIDDLFYRTNYEKWYNQKCESLKTNFVIKDTCFSTITLNYNFQTAIHKDKGDLKNGFGNLVVFRRGNWTGNNLCLPQYGICIYLDHGDYITFDVHQWHCNSKMIKSEINDENKNNSSDMRLSLVLYLRENIIKRCGKENNLESRKKKIVPFYIRIYYNNLNSIRELLNYSKGYNKIKDDSFLYSKIIYACFINKKNNSIHIGPLQYMKLLEYFIDIEPDSINHNKYLKYTLHNDKRVYKSMNANYCLIELFHYVQFYDYLIEIVILSKKNYLIKICL